MTSQSQIDANRQNAKLSTGPVTDAGKAVSAQNARTHGFTSRFVSLSNDQEREDYARLEAALLRDFNPAEGIESVLFQQMITTSWNMARCDARLASLTSDGHDLLDPASPAAAQARNVEIYYRRNERTFNRAVNLLTKVQTERAFRASLSPEAAGAMARITHSIVVSTPALQRQIKQRVADPPSATAPYADETLDAEQTNPIFPDPAEPTGGTPSGETIK